MAVEGDAQLLEGRHDVLLVGDRGRRQVRDRHGVAGEEQQRLDRAGERAHAAASRTSSTPGTSDRATVIAPNGSSCSHAASPRL